MADAHQKNHDYHIIAPSPWPILASLGAFLMAFGGVGYMRYLNGGSLHVLGIEWAHPWLFFIGLALVFYVMYGWWSDTVKEAHEGAHTRRVAALALWHDHVHRFGSDVLRCLVLGLFRRQPLSA